MTHPPPNDAADATEESRLGDQPDRSARRFVKPLLFLALIGLAAFLLTQFGSFVDLDYLATRESQLRSFQLQHPVLVFGIAFLIYVLVTGLSLPGAAALSLVYGWYFGFLPAFLLVSFASTAGATIAFLTSRYLFRESVQSKFGPRLESFNRHLEQQGAFYLFTLRLVPLVPFFVINLVMGLTPLKARTFWWVSQIGMLPGTMVYIYAGASVPSLSELAEKGAAAVFSPSQLLQLAIAFALLGFFPILIQYAMKFFQSTRIDRSID